MSTLTVEERLDRMEKALRTLAWWLVQAQTGFGQQDARGIEDILDGAGGARSGEGNVNGRDSPWQFRVIRGQQWLGVVTLRCYVSLRGPFNRPLFSERNRIRCVVVPLLGGWRVVFTTIRAASS